MAYIIAICNLTNKTKLTGIRSLFASSDQCTRKTDPENTRHRHKKLVINNNRLTIRSSTNYHSNSGTVVTHEAHKQPIYVCSGFLTHGPGRKARGRRLRWVPEEVALFTPGKFLETKTSVGAFSEAYESIKTNIAKPEKG